MRLATMFKGMLLSQGYVTTLRTLREVAPEALPVEADACGAGASAVAAGRRAAPPVPTAEAADEIDVAGAMPWRLTFAPQVRRLRARVPAGVVARAAAGAALRVAGAQSAGACCA
jgi:hypothetical protein